MANHKRKGPKSTRAGCLMCKPWKDQKESKTGIENRRMSDYRRDVDARQQLKD